MWDRRPNVSGFSNLGGWIGEIKDSEGAYFKEIIMSSLWACWVDKIMKSLWVMLEIEGSFTLYLQGFFPFTHSLVNGLCFKSQGCGALFMQQTLTDTCILEIEMRAKVSSEWGTGPEGQQKRPSRCRDEVDFVPSCISGLLLKVPVGKIITVFISTGSFGRSI